MVGKTGTPTGHFGLLNTFFIIVVFFKSCEIIKKLSLQLLRGVTIAAGGVLPNIHKELLSKKMGSKGKLEAIVTPALTKMSRATKKAVVKRLGTKASSRVKVVMTS